MKQRLKQNVEVKQGLSNTLINWLPLLQTNLNELEDKLKPLTEANPLINVQSGFEENFEEKLPKKHLYSNKNDNVKNYKADKIEALTIKEIGLYDFLNEQILPPLFPTRISQDIAGEIIENLDENGFYEGSNKALAKKLKTKEEEIEKIRKRFAYLEPYGIASKNIKECFSFQLENVKCSDEVYELCEKIIKDLENIYKYNNEKSFKESVKIIKSFKNPPALDFFEDSMQIIPDLYINFDKGNGIEISLNDKYYPKINIDKQYNINHDFIKQKMKEAKSLVEALEMRKATIYKVGLMLVEYQYDFFTGGNIKPLTLKVLADEFGHNTSTISRAISNKYISCNRGVIPMKTFFSTAIDEDISAMAIKNYLKELIKTENRKKPFSDNQLLDLIKEKFDIDMVRRTISKYRQQLNIASSSERKKLYIITK